MLHFRSFNLATFIYHVNLTLPSFILSHMHSNAPLVCITLQKEHYKFVFAARCYAASVCVCVCVCVRLCVCHVTALTLYSAKVITVPHRTI